MSELPAIVLLQIPRYHERVDDAKLFGRTFTVSATQVYEVEFRLETGTVSCIYKRYREFRELRNQVLFPQAKSFDLHFPGFPEKKWFGKRSSGVVERRRETLERWLQSFLRSRESLALLHHFLQTFTSLASGARSRTVTDMQDPETLPQTILRLVQFASKPDSALESISAIRALLTSENFQVRKTSTREFLSQSVVSWQRMHLERHILDPVARLDALTVFKVIVDSGQFERSQLIQILSESEDAYRQYRAWEEGTQREEEPSEALTWRPLPCGREDLEVEFRVKDQMMEMRVRMWVRAQVDRIVEAVTDCEARKRWDERIENVWVVKDEGQHSVIHYDLLLSGEPVALELRCTVSVKGDTAEMRYYLNDGSEDARLHSIYRVAPARRGRLRHSASTGDASTVSETYLIDYTIHYTESCTRLVLTDLLGSQRYFLQTWDNLKEFLELGYSSRRGSEVLPPRPRTLSHRSIAVSQGILRQLICSL